jgi:hypothetical protein
MVGEMFGEAVVVLDETTRPVPEMVPKDVPVLSSSPAKDPRIRRDDGHTGATKGEKPTRTTAPTVLDDAKAQERRDQRNARRRARRREKREAEERLEQSTHLEFVFKYLASQGINPRFTPATDYMEWLKTHKSEQEAWALFKMEKKEHPNLTMDDFCQRYVPRSLIKEMTPESQAWRVPPEPVIRPGPSDWAPLPPSPFLLDNFPVDGIQVVS